MRRLLAAFFLLIAFAAPGAALVDPAERLADPVQEERAREISKNLRCLVCQNQSIDDSDAELAGDLRRIVRERIAAGDSDEEVYDYVVARYGEFVLMTPPFEPETWVLWLAPLFFVLVGGAVAVAVLRRVPARAAEPGLSPEEAERVAALMKEGGNPEDSR